MLKKTFHLKMEQNAENISWQKTFGPYVILTQLNLWSLCSPHFVLFFNGQGFIYVLNNDLTLSS